MRPMRMRWRRCRCCATSSAAANCSPTRRTSRSKARWVRFTRPSADGQEPLVQRRQQTHRSVPVPVVPGEQLHPLSFRRLAPFGQQHIGRPDADDRRELHRGERRDDEGGGESDK